METNNVLLVVENENEGLFTTISPLGAPLEIRKADVNEAKHYLSEHSPQAVLFNLNHSEAEIKNILHEFRPKHSKCYWAISAPEIRPETLIDFIRLGVSDFLRQPIQEPEYSSLVQRVEDWRQKRSEGPEIRRVISFFSSKGGVGVTSLAVNLAATLMQKKAGGVLLADFDLQYGNVSEFLDMPPQYTLLHLLENLDRMDANLLENSLQKHRSGIFLLPHPFHPEESERFTPKETIQILGLLKKKFNYVLLDTGHKLDAPTIACLDQSDWIFLVTTPDLPSLYNTKNVLQTFKKLGYPQEKIKLILNRWKMKGEISAELIAKHVPCPVFHRVPDDPPVSLNSVNHGIPVLELAKNSELNKSYNTLADLVLQRAAARKKGK